ncbi:MAG: alpha/beta fold hydrolase [Chloroflexota bacterium]
MVHIIKHITRLRFHVTRKTLLSIKYSISLVFVTGLLVSLPSSSALAQDSDQPDTRPVDQQPGQTTSPNALPESAPASTASGWQASLQDALANPDQLIQPVLGMVESTSNVVGNVTQLANAQLDITLSTADDLANLVYDGYTFHDSGFTGPDDTVGPISIVPVTVRSSEDVAAPSERMWLITLSGAQSVEGQATGAQEAIIAGLAGDTAYQDAVVEAISNTVPDGEPIILAGHSLGGIVAQQLAQDSLFKGRYDIRNVVVFGAPAIRDMPREGVVRRLATEGDPVPLLGVQVGIGAHYEEAAEQCDIASYGFMNTGDSHLCGYLNRTAWGDYDVFGVKNGDAIVDVHYGERVFFEAPRD